MALYVQLSHEVNGGEITQSIFRWGDCGCCLRCNRAFENCRKYGVREYWIVDPKTETVAVHILAGGTYVKKDYNKTDVVPVNVVEGCFVDFGKVFS